MDFNQKLTDFKKRWSIVSEVNYEEEFAKFKTRILNILADVDQHIPEEGVAQFCQALGIPERWRDSHFDRRWGSNVIDAFTLENEEKKFYWLLQVLSYIPINTLMGYDRGVAYSRGTLFSKIKEAVEISNINLSMSVVDGGEVIFHPKGEETLDKALVEEVLNFLSPESQAHFVDALRFYSGFSAKNAIKSAEALRRSLEEFLRFKLKNKQGLDKNILALQGVLKTDGRDPIVRKVTFTTFTLLDQYFNENSKHQDGDISESENEFLIYQTGVLMRYVHKNIL